MSVAMTFLKSVVIVAVFALSGLAACKDNSEDKHLRSDTFAVNDQDTEMNNAMVRARDTFPEFWTAKSKGDLKYTDFNVKVGLNTSDNSIEHIWMTNVTDVNGQYSGTLVNEPLNIPNLKYGDTVSFTRKQVSDWQYFENGKSEGNFTTRVLLKTIPEEQARLIRETLGWEE